MRAGMWLVLAGLVAGAPARAQEADEAPASDANEARDEGSAPASSETTTPAEGDAPADPDAADAEPAAVPVSDEAMPTSGDAPETPSEQAQACPDPDPLHTKTWTGGTRKTTALERRMPRPWFSRGIMKRHEFRVPRTFDGAILSSHVGLRFGVAMLRKKGFIDPLDREYAIYAAGVTGRFSGGVGFTKWLGMYGRVEALGGLSTDSGADALFGMTGYTHWKLGLMGRPFRLQNLGLQLVLRAGVDGEHEAGVFVDIDDKRAEQTEGIRVGRRSTRGFFSANVALAITPAVGLHTGLQYAGGDHKRRLSRNDFDVATTYVEPAEHLYGMHEIEWGLSVELDGWPYLPLGFVPEYKLRKRWLNPKDQADDKLAPIDHFIAGTFLYTGTPRADVGVSVVFPISGHDDVTYVQTELILAVRL